MIIVGIDRNDYENHDEYYICDNIEVANKIIENRENEIIRIENILNTLKEKYYLFRSTWFETKINEKLPGENYVDVDLKIKNLHSKMIGLCKKYRNHNHPEVISIRTEITSLRNSISNSTSEYNKKQVELITQLHSEFDIDEFFNTLSDDEINIWKNGCVLKPLIIITNNARIVND